MDYIKTWKEIILKPSDFYSRMSTTGGYADPITFAAICIIINLILFTFVRPSMLKFVSMHDPKTNLSGFTLAIISIISGIIGLFILGLLFNFLYHLKAIGGAGTFKGTVRFISYANAPIVFSWIPIIGLLVVIYTYYLNIVGGMIVHNVSMKKSTIIMIPFILLTIIGQVRFILHGSEY